MQEPHAIGLAEREPELRRIAAGLRLGAQGPGSVVLVDGVAGIGKTRLLQTARAALREDGVLILSARGSELERGFAFGVMRSLLEPALVARDPESRAALLGGLAAAAGPVLGIGESTGMVEPTYGILNAIHWVVAGLAAETPVVLVVDDVQWADAPSLRALAFLCQRLDDIPVALLLGRRTGEASDDEDALTAIATGPFTQSLTLGPLGRTGITAISADVGLDAASFDGAAAQACLDLTGGNPLLARQVLDALVQDGLATDAETLRALATATPPSISSVVLPRLGRLSPGARDVARALATLGDSSDAPTVAEFLDSEVPVVVAGADELARASILERDRLAFTHPLLSAAVVSDRGAEAMSVDHAHAAQVLLRRGAPVDQVSSHLLRTNAAGIDGAAEALTQAAVEAFLNGAPETVVTLINRALREQVEPAALQELRTILGLAQLQTKQFEDSAASLRAAVGVGSPVDLWLARGFAVMMAEGVHASQTDLLSNAVHLPEHDAVAVRAWASVQVVMVDPSLRTAIDLPDPDAVPDEPWARPVLVAHAWHAWEAGELPAAQVAALAARGMADADLVADSSAPLVAHWIYGCLVLMASGAVQDCERALAALNTAVVRNGELVAAATLHNVRAMLLMQQGDLPRAVVDAEVSLRIAEQVVSDLRSAVLTSAIAVLAQARLATTGPVEAAAILDDLPLPDDPVARTFYRYTSGLVLLASGDAAGAVVELEQALAGAVFRQFIDLVPPYISALATSGDTERARTVAAESIAASRRSGGPHELAARLRAGALADPEGALDLLDEAVGILEDSPFRLELARTLIARGSHLRRVGQRTAARADLERGADQAVRCGAAPLAEQARAELVVLGARPRRLVTGGLESLTPSERRICALAADGLTNRAIAQELFLSVKTVETHLGVSFRKLDVTSRKELAAIMATDA